MKITVEFESLDEFENHFVDNQELKNKAIESKIESSSNIISKQLEAINDHIKILYEKQGH